MKNCVPQVHTSDDTMCEVIRICAHTHTRTDIYIYICTCVCVLFICVYVLYAIDWALFQLSCVEHNAVQASTVSWMPGSISPFRDLLDAKTTH